MESIDTLRREVCRNGSDRTVMLVADHIDKIEQEIKECCIELPKDADGNVWHVGDLVVGEVNPNNPKRVERMLWYGPDSGWQLETDSIIYPCPERPCHYKPPTVEDVLREFGDYYALAKGGCDEDGIIAVYAERLQLREED